MKPDLVDTAPSAVVGRGGGRRRGVVLAAAGALLAGIVVAAPAAFAATTAASGPIANGAKGFDVDASVSASQVSCLKTAGYSFGMLYTNISATNWKTTYSALKADGLQAVLQHGHETNAMFLTPSNGTSRGTDDVASAKAVLYPKGADYFLDAEQDSGTKATRSQMIQFINNWAEKIAAAGYTPGVYSGANSNLQESDLDAGTLPKVKVYWKSESDSAPDPDSGYVAVQDLGVVKNCGVGTGVDVDHAKIDQNGYHLVGSGGAGSGGSDGNPDGATTNGGWFEHTDSDWHGVVVGKSKDLFELRATPTSQWAVTDDGGQIAGTPSITHTGTRYDYWGLSAAGNVYQRTFDNGALGPWHAAGIATHFDPKSGIVALHAGNTFRLYGVGTNGNVYISTYSGGAWTTANILGNVTGTIGVVYVAGRYDVFGLHSGQVQHITYENGSWGAWHASAITTIFAANTGLAAAYAQGRYRVYGVGIDGPIYQNYYSDDDSQWHAQSLGGVYAGTPSITYNNGRYDVFGVSSTQNVYQQTFISGSGTGWSSPRRIVNAP